CKNAKCDRKGEKYSCLYLTTRLKWGVSRDYSRGLVANEGVAESSVWLYESIRRRIREATESQPAAQPHPNPVVACLPGTSRSCPGSELGPAATARALRQRCPALSAQAAARSGRRRGSLPGVCSPAGPRRAAGGQSPVWSVSQLREGDTVSSDRRLPQTAAALARTAARRRRRPGRQSGRGPS